MIRSEEYINNLLESGELKQLETVKEGVHYLKTLVTESSQKKEITAINYKTDLKSGIRLNPIFDFTNDGLLENTIYYFEDKPVLKVSEMYTYNALDLQNDNMMLSKKAIHGRVKKWQYYFEDGTLDTSDDDNGRSGEDRLTSKEKSKIYESVIQGLTVGNKRRHVIQMSFSERAGICLVLLGIFPGPKEVQDDMRRLSSVYSSSFQEYQKYGTEDILENITNDTTFTWLNITFPTNLQLDQMEQGQVISSTQKTIIKSMIDLYSLQNIQGMTIRKYMIEKLKGNTL